MLDKIKKIITENVQVSEYFGLYEFTSNNWEDLDKSISKVCDEFGLVEVLNANDVVILGQEKLALKVLGLS